MHLCALPAQDIPTKARTLLKLLFKTKTLDDAYAGIAGRLKEGVQPGQVLKDLSVGVHGRVDFANSMAGRASKRQK